MSAHPLTQAQQAALNLNYHTLVEAGAGTGKTRVLVQRSTNLNNMRNSIVNLIIYWVEGRWD